MQKSPSNSLAFLATSLFFLHFSVNIQAQIIDSSALTAGFSTKLTSTITQSTSSAQDHSVQTLANTREVSKNSTQDSISSNTEVVFTVVNPSQAIPNSNSGFNSSEENIASTNDDKKILNQLKAESNQTSSKNTDDVNKEGTLNLFQKGLASWYGPGFHGKKTANGSVFNMFGMSAAHRTLPLGSYIRVVNPISGESLRLLVNDRGPYSGKRVLDVSYAAAKKLGLVQKGVGHVHIFKD